MMRTSLSVFLTCLGSSPMFLAGLAGPAGAQSCLFHRATAQPAAPALYWAPVAVQSAPAATATTTATSQPPTFVAPALSYYPVVAIPGYAPLSVAAPAPATGSPAAPRSYLAGFQPEMPALPALGSALGTSIGLSVAQELGGFLLDRLRQRLASQGTTTPTPTDQAALFKDLLNHALSLFAQRTGGYQPNAEDLRAIVDLVTKVLGERAAGGPSPGGSMPGNLTINASIIQVTIPLTANIFLQQSGSPRPADNAQAPKGQAGTGAALGESGPPSGR